MVGGILFYKWAFAPAVNAQQAIVNHGWEYKGTATLSQSDYNSLKSDLALRDLSLQTSTDLVIVGATSTGELVITYDFYSINNYPNLSRQKPSGSFGTGSSIVPVLYFTFLIFGSFVLLLKSMGLDKKANKTHEVKV
jgi:hypothetical protein